jgi:GTP pyrophosphokinase
VTILTKATSRPKRDWLNYVRSSKARTKIRHEIQIEQRDKAIILGRDLLAREVEKYDLSPRKVLTEDALQHLAVEKFHLKDTESIHAQVGYGKITPHNVVGKLLPPETLRKPEPVPKKVGILGEIFQKVRRKNRAGIRVGGHSDILVTLGKCCAALPGDSVTGFITRGRGVMVHRMDCDKVLASDPERRVEVSWERAPDVLHHAKMKVITVNRPGILANLTKLISNIGVNIAEANIRSTSDEKAINLFTVEIVDRAQLEQVMRGLEGVKGVISVQKI